MLDQLVPRSTFEFVQVTLKICPGHLASRTNAAGEHFLCHTARLELEQMWSFLVNTRYQQSNTIRSPAVLLCVRLRTIGDSRCDVGKEDRSIVRKSRGE